MKMIYLFLLLMIPFVTFSQITISAEQSRKADAIVNKFKSPFVKFDDGQVVSIRKMVLKSMGVQFPKIGTNTNTWSWRIVSRYKVMDNTDSGCRIEPVNVYGEYYDTNTDTDLFVDDLEGYSGRMYGAIFLRKMDIDFTYTTALGGRRTIPRYEFGIPATEQEFREYLKTL